MQKKIEKFAYIGKKHYFCGRNRQNTIMDIIKKDLGDNAEAEVVLYQPDSSIHIEVLVEGETVWLTQQQMSELFSTTRNNITLHIRNIFNEGELDEDSVCKESLRTAEMVFFEGGFYRKWRKESHDR